jgi:hypothetical protein
MSRKPVFTFVAVVVLTLVLAIPGYFFVIRPQGQPGKPEVVAPVEKVNENPQAPVTPNTPAGGTTATTTVEQPTTPKPTETPPRTEVATKPEPRTRTAEAKVGQLSVIANVEGARISIDGKSDPGWLTPHTFPDIPAGAHNIAISKDGYESVQQSVTVEAGTSSSVTVSLSSPKAELDIVTKPAGAEILIDGKPYGSSPVRVTLPPGDHTYMAKLPGAAPYAKTVTLQSGSITTKTIEFGVHVTTGIVEVRTIPSGATVLADGTPVSGQTPISFRLPVGSHTLVISVSGYRPIQRQVTVSEYGTTPTNITFTSQGGIGEVRTIPPGATVPTSLKPVSAPPRRPSPVERYPNIEAPDTVSAGQEISVQVSLTSEQISTETKILSTAQSRVT